MPTGWEQLGSFLGGGINRDQAYAEGQLYTAKTATALEQAKERRLANISEESRQRAMSRMAEEAAAAGLPNPGLFGTLAEAGGGNAQQLANALLGVQEYGFRGTAGDPATDALTRTRALGAVAGKPYSDLQQLGPGQVTNITADQPTVDITPLGDSLIEQRSASARASDALASLRTDQQVNPGRYRAPGTGGAAGGADRPSWAPPEARLGQNQMWNPAFDPSRPANATDNRMTLPLPGSPADPEAPAVAGSRESVFNERVFLSAAQGIPDIGNMMRLPAVANTGVLGIGSRPGQSVTQATVDALRLNVASDVVKAYEMQSSQIARALAWIESNGLAPSEAIIKSFDNLVIRPGHNGFDALRSFANMRQTVDQMARIKLANPRIPESMKNVLRELQMELHEQIPFTVEDVMDLQFGNGKYETMADLVRKKGLDGRALAAPAASATPATPAAIQPGHRDVDDEGNEWEYGGGDPNDPNNWYPVAK